MKPVIFNGEMVRAILEGRKTQTRRPIKNCSDRGDGIIKIEKSTLGRSAFGAPENLIGAAPFQVGDVLYLRETFCDFYNSPIYYRADGEMETLCYECGLGEKAHHMGGQEHTWMPHKPKWTPSIHMPKELSRIHLEVTRVRVERACDISEEDARAEGFKFTDDAFVRENFRDCWQSIYGPDAWEKWVFVYDIKRVK